MHACFPEPEQPKRVDSNLPLSSWISAPRGGRYQPISVSCARTSPLGLRTSATGGVEYDTDSPVWSMSCQGTPTWPSASWSPSPLCVCPCCFLRHTPLTCPSIHPSIYYLLCLSMMILERLVPISSSHWAWRRALNLKKLYSAGFYTNVYKSLHALMGQN